LDEKFPQLLRLANANHAGVLFQAANLLHGNTAGSPPTTRYHVFPIRFRPGERHVLRFEVSNDGETADELRTVFAKLYSCAEEALRSYRVACQVADRLPPCGDGVTAVRPLACLQEDAVVLFPRLDGTTLSSHIKLAGTNCQRWIHCAGEGLRVLHDGVPIEPVPTLIDDLKRDRGFAKDVKKMVRRTCHHIHALLPEVGTQISELLLRAKELYERLPQEPPTLTHGDLKADHLWITRTGLKLIDFDTCTVADPALDVGKFLADLRWWHTILDLDELELTQAHFLDAYGAGAPPARLQRARVYESLVLIRLGVHRLPLFAEDWADRTRQLVTKAEGVLQELSNSIR
jgi:aminoglycoside phosphotransferase (APT) family kinase protein